MRRAVLAASVAAATRWALGSAHAQSRYPDRPVRIIVGYPPGGGADFLARVAAQGLTQRLGQSFVVDNRAGASGNIGATMAARAEPDGYTLLMGQIGSNALSNALYVNPGFNAATDFKAISLVAELPNVVLVPNRSPVQSFADLISYARANPGRLTYGSAGTASTIFMFMELLKARYGLNITHVQYRGSAPMQTALIAGEVDMTNDNITTAMPQVQAGTVRALAVTSARRSEVLPDVPSVVEAGFPDLVVTSWFGLVAPTRTPPGIIEMVSRGVQETLREPEVIARLRQLGAVPVGSTPEEYEALMARERTRWAEVIRVAGVRPE